MAGWSYTGQTRPIAAYANGNPDGFQKLTAFPALAAGNAGWLQEFAYRVSMEFSREVKARTSAATLICSANNGSGDTNGVGGVLTLTFTTA